MGDEDSIYALPDPRGLDAAAEPGKGKITFDTLLPSVCPAYIEAVKRGREAAPRDKNVLVHSETGCGKHFFFHALWNASNHDEMPTAYVNFNAGPTVARPPELTGIVEERSAHALPSIPVLERANGGTLFVAGIERARVDVQWSLLHVLAGEKVETPDGRRIRLDFRIICSSRLPLEELQHFSVLAVEFYRRVAQIRIWLPPLRERQADIEPYLKQFLAWSAARHGKPTPQCRPEVIEALKKHHFPRNLQELRSIADALVLRGKGEKVTDRDLSRLLVPAKEETPPTDASSPSVPLDRNLNAATKRHVLETLAICEGNRTKTADALGINRTTLWKYLKEWGFDKGSSQ